MTDPILIDESKERIFLLPKMANRHGSIAGAMGTGANTKLFKQVQKTLTQLEAVYEGLARNYAFQQKETARVLIVGSLTNLLFHILTSVGRVGSSEARFFRDYVSFFNIEFPGFGRPTDVSGWIAPLQGIIKQSAAEFSQPDLATVDLMQVYDRDNGTSYADAARGMYFRLANAFVKSDGTVSRIEEQVLARLKEALYRRTNLSSVAASDQQVAAIVPEKIPAGTDVNLPRADLDDLMRQLKSLIGLDTVKADITQLVNFLKVQQLRAARGMKTERASRHLVFSGNPGTGKTTVARLIAQIYNSLGFLSKGQLVETERSGLVGAWMGQTALRTKERADEATGGVLFVDQAYALKQRDDDCFGQEAIDTLVKLMEDRRENLVVIVAGYTQKMHDFLLSNPGLRSRFNKYFSFADYTPEELTAIYKRFAANAGLHLSSTGEVRLRTVFNSLYEKRDETFGNGRLARNLFEATMSKQANRIVSLPSVNDAVLSTIEMSDIPELSAIPIA
jgi:ATPase family protein associated with various cellular activities (AAA)/AAA lid domain-containing protein